MADQEVAGHGRRGDAETVHTSRPSIARAHAEGERTKDVGSSPCSPPPPPATLSPVAAPRTTGLPDFDSQTPPQFVTLRPSGGLAEARQSQAKRLSPAGRPVRALCARLVVRGR